MTNPSHPIPNDSIPMNGYISLSMKLVKSSFRSPSVYKNAILCGFEGDLDGSDCIQFVAAKASRLTSSFLDISLVSNTYWDTIYSLTSLVNIDTENNVVSYKLELSLCIS